MACGNYLGTKSERETKLRRKYNGADESRRAAKHAGVTWLAFIAAGLMPLWPFMRPAPVSRSFWLSVALTAATLFAVGAMRTWVTKGSGPGAEWRCC